MTPETQGIPNEYLGQNVAIAHSALQERLTTPAEVELLREFQGDALQKVVEALGRGETAMCLAEATGVGKTVIALQLTQALAPVLEKDGHGKIIFISPTLDILDQTKRSADRFAEGITVSNFYGKEKNTRGTIINTTYQSLPSLLKQLTSEAQDVRLVIGDEIHEGQGKERIKPLGDMPNAIFIGLSATPDVDTLKRHIKNGEITGKERWVGMFHNVVHGISLGEGIERRILSGLHIHTIKTKFQANISMDSTGQYSASELDAFMANPRRTLMTVAMIAGLETVDKSDFTTGVQEEAIRFDEEEVAEIERAHQEIAGLPTLVFGRTIRHATAIQQMLERAGVAAATYHSQLKPTERKELKTKFQAGEIQVLIGVKALGIGLDMPEATVGMFITPSRDANDLAQKLGRLLRRAPGKARAITIQFYDEFAKGKAPVLIPELFNPKTIELNVEKQEKESARRAIRERQPGEESPNITFSGMSAKSIFQSIEASLLIQLKLNKAKTMDDVRKVIDEVVTHAYGEANGDTLAFYRGVADGLPYFVSDELMKKAQDEGAGDVMFWLNLKTILGVVDRFPQLDPEEAIQQAVTVSLEKIGDLPNTVALSNQLHKLVKEEMYRMLAVVELAAFVTQVKSAYFPQVKKAVEDYLRTENPDPSSTSVENLIDKIMETVPEASENMTRERLRGYIYTKLRIQFVDLPLPETPEEYILRKFDLEQVAHVMETVLTPRERLVLSLRLGIGTEDGGNMPLGKVGSQLGITPERVRQLEMAAFAKLRHPKAKQSFEVYLPPEPPRKTVGLPPNEIITRSNPDESIYDSSTEKPRMDRQRHATHNGYESSVEKLFEDLNALQISSPRQRREITTLADLRFYLDEDDDEY